MKKALEPAKLGSLSLTNRLIHAAHFFFLSRFISPAVNHRADIFGGSTENRSRILLEILDGIRKAAPGLHITVKINCNDFTRGGLDETACLAICGLLDAAGGADDEHHPREQFLRDRLHREGG